MATSQLPDNPTEIARPPTYTQANLAARTCLRWARQEADRDEPNYQSHEMFMREAQVWATLAQAAATYEGGRE